MVDHVAGELVELVAGNKARKDDKQIFYSELLYIAKTYNYNPYWANHKYRERFGVWPKGLLDTTIPPSITTQKWVKNRMIAWSKGKGSA
jgi:hypothetical protein